MLSSQAAATTWQFQSAVDLPVGKRLLDMYVLGTTSKPVCGLCPGKKLAIEWRQTQEGSCSSDGIGITPIPMVTCQATAPVSFDAPFVIVGKVEPSEGVWCYEVGICNGTE